MQVRLDTSLVSRTLLVDLIHDEINRIYYILLAILTDNQIETTSDYWMQYTMTGVSVVYPTTQVVNGITVPLNDFTIQPASNVDTHWEDLVDAIEVRLIVLLERLFTVFACFAMWPRLCDQWRWNEFESGGGHRSGTKVGEGYRSGAKCWKKNFWSCPSTFFGSKSTISRFGERFRDVQYSMVSFLFAVFLLTVPPVSSRVYK